jgi:hypothetical protein
MAQVKEILYKTAEDIFQNYLWLYDTVDEAVTKYIQNKLRVKSSIKGYFLEKNKKELVKLIKDMYKEHYKEDPRAYHKIIESLRMPSIKEFLNENKTY